MRRGVGRGECHSGQGRGGVVVGLEERLGGWRQGRDSQRPEWEQGAAAEGLYEDKLMRHPHVEDPWMDLRVMHC